MVYPTHQNKVRRINKLRRTMSKHYYTVKDSTGHVIRTFPTYQQASTYKFVYGNSGWTIC